MELSGIRTFVRNSPITATTIAVATVTAIALMALEGVKLLAGQNFSWHGHSALEWTGILGASAAGAVFLGGVLAQQVYRKYHEARIERQQQEEERGQQAAQSPEPSPPESPVREGQESVRMRATSTSQASAPVVPKDMVSGERLKQEWDAFLGLADELPPSSLIERFGDPKPANTSHLHLNQSQDGFFGELDVDPVSEPMEIPKPSAARGLDGKPMPSPAPAQLVISAHTLTRYNRYAE